MLHQSVTLLKKLVCPEIHVGVCWVGNSTREILAYAAAPARPKRIGSFTHMRWRILFSITAIVIGMIWLNSFVHL